MSCTTCCTIICIREWYIAHCKFARLVHTTGVRFVIRLCVSCKRRSADSIERHVTQRKCKFGGNPGQ